MGRRRKLASAKDIKDVKAAMALKQSATISEAYKKMHPLSSDESARKNAKNMLTPEVVSHFKELMGLEDFGKASRGVLEKILFTVVARWYSGLETTANLLTTVKLLTLLVPEFKERYQLEDTDTEADVDRKLREAGIDPTQFERN